MSIKGTHHERPQQPPQTELDKNVIRAQVILGCPSTGCEGVGICRVIGAKQPINIKCPVVIAFISTTEQGKIRFSFLKTSMAPRYLRKHFRWLLFQVGEVHPLSRSITRRLQMPANYSIDPGIYPVWETPEFMVVDY